MKLNDLIVELTLRQMVTERFCSLPMHYLSLHPTSQQLQLRTTLSIPFEQSRISSTKQIGHALSDMLFIEAILAHKSWAPKEWDSTYTDLPQSTCPRRRFLLHKIQNDRSGT